MDRQKAIQLWDETERMVNERGAGYISDPASMWIEPFRIFGGLYYVGDKVVCVHLLDTGDGLILFDSGFPHAAGQLLGNIRSLGFDPADIKYVVHSHEHFDHFGATRMLQTKYRCKTFIHRLGAETFRIHPHHTELQASRCPDAALFIPDEELSDGEEIRLGDMVIQCIHTPGHSAGATSYFFDIEENGKILRAGLCGVNGNLTLHPGRLLKYGIPFAAGDDYLASIKKIQNETVDITLDTHPRPRGIIERRALMLGNPDTNPFVDPEAWHSNLEDYHSRYLESLSAIKRKLDEQ